MHSVSICCFAWRIVETYLYACGKSLKKYNNAMWSWSKTQEQNMLLWHRQRLWKEGENTWTNVISVSMFCRPQTDRIHVQVCDALLQISHSETQPIQCTPADLFSRVGGFQVKKCPSKYPMLTSYHEGDKIMLMRILGRVGNSRFRKCEGWHASDRRTHSTCWTVMLIRRSGSP